MVRGHIQSPSWSFDKRRRTVTSIHYIIRSSLVLISQHGLLSSSHMTDCQNYDEIAPEDLDKHPEAYTAFCDHDAPDDCHVSLDMKMPFGSYLPFKEWAFVYSNELTVRNSYHLSRWNVVYDLKGDEFFAKSGLKEFCEGKLNDHWFMNAEEAVDVVSKEEEDKILNVEVDKLLTN